MPDNYCLRLPTEAEWEKAGRGGLKLPQRLLTNEISEFREVREAGSDSIANPNPKREYPWEHEPGAEGPDPEKANYADSQIGATSAVGCFPAGASPYEIYELSGNVWEWTQSLDMEYPYDPSDGREDLRSDGDRVLRGGSYFNRARALRCALRYWNLPDCRFRYVGFRVVVAPGLL
jgi:formylglycine-generating enzyme required for sulfatase activity